MQLEHPRLEILSAYADHDLADQEQADVALHVEGCAHCQAELESLQQILVAFRTLPTLDAPTGFSSRVMDRIEAREQQGFWALFRRWRVASILAPIAVATLVVVIARRPESESISIPAIEQAKEAFHERAAEAPAAPAPESGRDGSTGNAAAPANAPGEDKSVPSEVSERPMDRKLDVDAFGGKKVATNKLEQAQPQPDAPARSTAPSGSAGNRPTDLGGVGAISNASRASDALEFEPEAPKHQDAELRKDAKTKMAPPAPPPPEAVSGGVTGMLGNTGAKGSSPGASGYASGGARLKEEARSRQEGEFAPAPPPEKNAPPAAAAPVVTAQAPASAQPVAPPPPSRAAKPRAASSADAGAGAAPPSAAMVQREGSLDDALAKPSETTSRRSLKAEKASSADEQAPAVARNDARDEHVSAEKKAKDPRISQPPDQIVALNDGPDRVRQVSLIVQELKGFAAPLERLENGVIRIRILLLPGTYPKFVKELKRRGALGATPPASARNIEKVWVEINPSP